MEISKHPWTEVFELQVPDGSHHRAAVGLAGVYLEHTWAVKILWKGDAGESFPGASELWTLGRDQPKRKEGKFRLNLWE